VRLQANGVGTKPDARRRRATVGAVSRRPPTLGPLDSRADPLPHGTEVSTRVERLLGERRIPQGVVGRVRAARDGGYEVAITGIGIAWYARDELLPRRPGQVRFAQRREEAWDALRACRVLEAEVGSRAWNLADERSDVDRRGAFALPFAWTLGLAEPPDCLVSAGGSDTYWECGKLVLQALRADPNTLELLFVPGARPLDPIGAWLLEAREAFASLEIFGSFGRYALSQLHKLSRSARLAEHRGLLLDWLQEEPAPGLDAVAERLADLSERPAPTRADAELAAKEYVKQLYRSLFDQGLIAACDFDSLVGYARTGGKQPPPARELRPKNAYNLLRLIAAATSWLGEGRPTFAVGGALREKLLAVKRGQVSLERVLAEAEAMMPALEAARDASPLPRGPDVGRADALLARIQEEVARRHFSGEPGPWAAPGAVNPE
jgi:hypothetical protein